MVCADCGNQAAWILEARGRNANASEEASKINFFAFCNEHKVVAEREATRLNEAEKNPDIYFVVTPFATLLSSSEVDTRTLNDTTTT